jgi:topoisomerase-4 subunit A
MVVLEKWVPKKPISAIYYDGEKSVILSASLVEAENKEENFITEHPKSQLEIVSTDYRPVAELIFRKSREFKRKLNIDIEDFIAKRI